MVVSNIDARVSATLNYDIEILILPVNDEVTIIETNSIN